VLGIGRGDSSLGYLGRKPASVATFATCLRRLRGYLRGDAVDLDGSSSRNVWIAEASTQPVPIDVAATGPKVNALAARCADRVTFSVGGDPRRIHDAIALVRAEREAFGLDPAGLSVGACVNVVAHPDVATARRLARGGAATFAHFSGMSGAPKTNTTDDAVFQAIDERYDLAGHARADADHAAAIPDEFLDRFAVVGPVEHCISRLSDLIDAGAERLVVVPGSRDADPGEVAASLVRLAGEVLPALR